MSVRILKIFKPPILDSITLWCRDKTNRFLKLILLTFLSFILTISWTPIASGQIPFLNINQTGNQQNVIDFLNRPFDCGNFVCSEVWLNGYPIFTVASYPIDQSKEDNVLPVDYRAKLIQNKLKKILELALTRKNISQTNVLESDAIEENNIDTPLPTPTFQVSILNGETVIVFPEQFGAPQKIIITLTQADFLHHNKTKQELAQEWQKIISLKMSEAIKEKDPSSYTEEQLNDFKKSIFFILVTLALSFGVFWLQKLCKSFYLQIKHQLQIIEKSISIDPEFTKSEDLVTKASQLNSEINQQQKSSFAS